MKIFFRYTVILIGLFFCFSCAYSQGFIASRYDADPIHLNPSLTGDFDGGWRMTLNYDELKTMGTPFKNYMISYDQPVYIKSNKVGIGLSALHDETGNKIFNKEKVYISASWFTQYRNNIIKIGAQGGYVRSNIKLENEIWPDQYNQILGTFDPLNASGEYIDNNVAYFDLNIGASCKWILPRHTPQLGFALQHFNSPKINYTASGIELKPVFVIHGTTDWNLNRKIYFTPTVIYKTNFGENYLVYGSSCSYKFASQLLEKSVFAGIDMKNSYTQFSALSFYGGVRYNQWQFGASYDYNLSKSGFAIRGPFEVYIRYIALSSRIRNYSIPCPRF